MTRWGVYFGIFTGVFIFALSWVLPVLLSSDSSVHELATPGLWLLAISQPICGVVFVLDGVLMGAGDARYLGLVGVVNLAAYLPMLWAVDVLAQDQLSSMIWIWVSFAGGYMLARMITLGLRARTDKWMRLGL